MLGREEIQSNKYDDDDDNNDDNGLITQANQIKLFKKIRMIHHNLNYTTNCIKSCTKVV